MDLEISIFFVVAKEKSKKKSISHILSQNVMPEDCAFN